MKGLGIGQRAEAWPCLCCRRSQEGEDLAELVDFVLALEEGLARQQLSKDTAQRPDVDLETVFVGPKKEVWAAVPECDNELSEVGWRRITCVASHAEVGELDLAAVVEEEIGGFEVSVQDPVRMEVFRR